MHFIADMKYGSVKKKYSEIIILKVIGTHAHNAVVYLPGMPLMIFVLELTYFNELKMMV